jgi:hypothetical protein
MSKRVYIAMEVVAGQLEAEIAMTTRGTPGRKEAKFLAAWLRKMVAWRVEQEAKV